ncbi:MAG: transcriptional regulator [Edaphobacter sp.]|nr:transcriptional regulator [Edaphobacter sp.]
MVCIHWEVGTRKIYTYPKESELFMEKNARNAGKSVGKLMPYRGEKVSGAKAKEAKVTLPAVTDPKLEALVREIIERVADKWTMLVLEVLEEHGVVRFTRLGALVGGVSQKMLTQTVRQMERDGLITRTVHPVIPPKVEYELTELGRSLGEAFCGVWIWAEAHTEEIERARAAFKARE